METRNLRYMPGHLSLNLLIDMDNKITALSDDELMEVSGGASSSVFNCLNISSESECKKKAICRWNSDKKSCENIDWLLFTKL